MKELEKIIARTHCFMHQSFFRPIYIFNNDAYFSDFRAQKFPLIFFNVNPFNINKPCMLVFLIIKKQRIEGTRKVSGRSVVFSAFYAVFCLCPKLVIITTLKQIILDLNSVDKIRPRGYIKKSCSTQQSMKFFLLTNVKMPTMIGISTFLSKKNGFIGLSEPEKAKFLDIFILLSI